MADGLNQETARVCQCSHWSSTHRNGGRDTCEGFRCGCYTFRQVTINAFDYQKGPKCPKCSAVVRGKVVIPGRTLKIVWQHISDTLKDCYTEEAVYASEQIRAQLEYAGSYDDYDPYDDLLAAPKPRKLTDAEIREEAEKLPKPFNGPKINEWELDLARSRAERNAPQRAPLVIGEEEV